MQRQTEIALLQELLDLQQRRSPFLDEHWQRIKPARYTCPDTFAREQQSIGRALPQIAAHLSQLRNPGDFVTADVAGAPLLLTRDDAGNPHAFYNVCRHRGARLVDEKEGCRKRLSCPYHGWTWSTAGELVGVPHEKTGFPGLDRSDFGLQELPCEEFGGWLWVCVAGDTIDVAGHLGELGPELAAMDAAGHEIFATDTREIDANWKLLVEGGIEAYHFRVAHRDTIAPLFLDNLSSYRCFGPHMRSVLPRSTLPELAAAPAQEWQLASHANVLYSLLPGSQFLVQEDHFVWIRAVPLAADRTRLYLSTVIPAAANVPERQDYWRRHHRLTTVTLDEDFALAEGIQQGLASGANSHLNFGRFEGALAAFNDTVDALLAN